MATTTYCLLGYNNIASRRTRKRQFLDLGTGKWLDIFISTRGNSRKTRRDKVVGARLVSSKDKIGGRDHECSEAQVRSFLALCCPVHELVICRAKFIPVTCGERNDIPVSGQKQESNEKKNGLLVGISFVLTSGTSSAKTTAKPL